MSRNNKLKKSLIEDYPNFSDFKPINVNSNNTDNFKKTESNVNYTSEYNTLSEGICISIKRELIRIYNKTQYVVIPRCTAADKSELRNWDLWGPLFFTMLLSYFLSNSKSADELSQTFCLVFILMWLGGSIITLNAILLGSKITLMQSLCVLGYCLFPVLVAAIILNYLEYIMIIPIRLGIGAGAFIWASTSSMAFMGDIVGQDKKGLATFPVYLFYFAFCCYLLL